MFGSADGLYNALNKWVCPNIAFICNACLSGTSRLEPLVSCVNDLKSSLSLLNVDVSVQPLVCRVDDLCASVKALDPTMSPRPRRS